MVVCEVIVYEITVPGVHDSFLVKGCADSPNHATDCLRAGSLGVENAARVKHPEHPTHSNLRRVPINLYLGEIGGEGLLREAMIRIAWHDGALGLQDCRPCPLGNV